MYVSIHISDGLGNRFFQLAAMIWYSKKHKCKPVFIRQWINKNSHSGPYDIDFYFPEIPLLETIPEDNWSSLVTPFSHAHKYIDLQLVNTNVLLKGYFQAWQYIDLPIPRVLLEPGFHTPNSFFLHVRRGDYLHPACKHHVVDLNNYLKRAYALMPSDATVIVCSDDIIWCKQNIPSLVGNGNYVFYEGDNYETLRMMVHCDLGGICANSTFSWWGAYWGHRMNSNRLYTMPDIWGYKPLPPAEDLLPPWATIVAVV